jgi:hypothetical protein
MLLKQAGQGRAIGLYHYMGVKSFWHMIWLVWEGVCNRNLNIAVIYLEPNIAYGIGNTAEARQDAS